MSTTPQDGTPRGQEIVEDFIKRQKERAERAPNPLRTSQHNPLITPNPKEAA